MTCILHGLVGEVGDKPCNKLNYVKKDNRMSKSWGYHLILDCKGGREIVKEDLKDFVIQLVEEIDMVITDNR